MLLQSTEADGSNQVYAAGGKDTSPILQLNASYGALMTRGIFVDDIASLAAAFVFSEDALLGLEGNAKVNLSTVLSLVMWLNTVVVPLVQSQNSDPDEIWRTLIADVNGHIDDPEREENHRALPGFGTYFEELLVWVQGIVTADSPIDANKMTEEEFQE